MKVARVFKPNWKITLFTFALLPVLLLLGFWQLDREQEKRALQAEYEQRTILAPVELTDVDAAADNAFLRVRGTGRYDNEHIFLLDNRIHNGVVGYEVVQLFESDGQGFFVNRGWLPLGGRRDIMPAIPVLAGLTEMRGSIYTPESPPFLLAVTELADKWPQVIQSVDIPVLANAIDAGATFPYLVRLSDDSPAVLQPNWSLVNMSPEKHRAYAVQWFVMAVVLLLLFIYTSFHRDVRSDRSQPETGDE